MTKLSEFKAEVCEQDCDKPCFVLLNNYGDIGLGVGAGRKHVSLWLPKGTTHDDAKKLAKMLNAMKLQLSIQ